MNQRRLSGHWLFTLCLLLLCLGWSRGAHAQTRKRVVFQAFWWNFANTNYPQGWANYLVDLAPRLKALGVDAVWVPVNVKNANPFSVGYSPFDHYDLGDKYQKGNLKTPLGDKDEFLRMVAVMHANGIEVVEDLVFNHMDGAGSATGQGAVDVAGQAFYRMQAGLPTDPTGGNKNFRYACFETAVGDETEAEYLARKGRFSKNWQNFYPNPSDTRFTGDDPTNTVFGPDIGFNAGSWGLASGTAYNPPQQRNYMRDGMRTWAVWMKKQTGVDGFRLDAVKHFPTYAAEDFLFNLQRNAGFASGTDEMLAVGEWVGGKGEIDAWANNVQNRAGTFDFSLRGFSGTPGLYGMVYGNGNYDMGNLPSQQQDNRSRTFPFVNNHDTFRPPLLANGNYPVGTWSSGSELASNIDPRQPRLAAAYAVQMAMDGNPNVFIEDLFDLGTTGKRATHLPTSTIDLPLRDDIANLTACHQKLGFKAGAYRVPYQAVDYLIIERAGKAVIGITDNLNTWQAQFITTSFPAGTRLIDYGGSSPATDVRVVPADGRVQISTPPCNGTARRRGYSVWAPEGQSLTFSPTAIVTNQEWELADDLGDSHPRSLQQGGALPANSRAIRRAGKVYPALGTLLTVNLYPTDTTNLLTLLLTDGCGQVVDSVSGRATLTLTHRVARQGWYQLMARQATVTAPGQRVFVKASYTAPATLDARANPSFIPTTVELGLDRGLCQFTERLEAGTGTGFTYAWFDSSGRQVNTGVSFAPPVAGRYRVLKTNAVSGCTAQDSVRVLTLYPLPTQPQIRQSNDTLLIDLAPGITYQWTLSGTEIVGATGSRFVPTRNGTYIVRATSGQGCKISSPFFSYLLSARGELLSGLGLAPNPAQGMVRLSLSGLASSQSRAVTVRSINGRQVYRQILQPSPSQTLNIPLQGLSAGLYLVELETQAGKVAKKLVVE